MGRGRHLGEFEQVTLLAVARLEADTGANGPAIHREIHEQTGRDVSQASVYVTLARLERKGWVIRSAEPRAEPGSRPRGRYELTTAGVVELQTAHRILARLWPGVPFDPLDGG